MKISNFVFLVSLSISFILVLKRNFFSLEQRPHIVRNSFLLDWKENSNRMCLEIPESETLRVSLYVRCYPWDFPDRKVHMQEGRREAQELDLSL